MSLVTGEVLDEEILPKQLLVSHHRDYHLADIQARRFMSQLLQTTGDEETVREKMKEIRERGYRTAEAIAKMLRKAEPAQVSKALFGLKRKEYYFRYKKYPASDERIEAYLQVLKERAEKQHRKAIESGRGLRVLLTGGTGFVGQEILWQAARDESIEEMVVLIRPKTIRDRKTGEVLEVLSPQTRGEELLRRLWLEGTDAAAKFRFVAGDVEAPNLGVDAKEKEHLAKTLTHVIHCAASVAFDDPYEKSFRANVTGTLNALEFSESLQEAEGSPFVHHISIETSYIHGRQVQHVAREDEVVFPRNFYNNYYELTKAMASIESERFMLSRGLRVVQLCPAIVIGEAATGNNRGDTKVVNAPVNVFGRAHEAMSHSSGKLFERSKTSMLAKMACVFPGDPSARINLIPVDWVSQGILAAVRHPRAVGERVHLATDNHITSEEMIRIVEEEIGVKIRLAEPTVHRNLTMPVMKRVLGSFHQERLGKALEKLGTIFGGYSEWGQPIHQVGNDVEVLGMPSRRPETHSAFRMLCRHNRWVQEFGKIRDADEISRREKVWQELVETIGAESGLPVGAIPAAEFRRRLAEHLDEDSFTKK